MLPHESFRVAKLETTRKDSRGSRVVLAKNLHVDALVEFVKDYLAKNPK